MIERSQINACPTVARSRSSTVGSAQSDHLSDAGVDEDLLLVSQIGGLRAKSAQAQAANAKLNAAINEARERQASEKARKQRCQQERLRLLSRWVVLPKESETVGRLLGAWRLITIELKVRHADAGRRELERCQAQLERFRQHVLTERREQRLRNLLHGIRQNNSGVSNFGGAATSPREHVLNGRCRTVALPMGLIDQELVHFCFSIWHHAAAPRRRHKRASSRRITPGEAFAMRCSRSPPPHNHTLSSNTVASCARRVSSPDSNPNYEGMVTAFGDRLERLVAIACKESCLGAVFWSWRHHALAMISVAAVLRAGFQRIAFAAWMCITSQRRTSGSCEFAAKNILQERVRRRATCERPCCAFASCALTAAFFTWQARRDMCRARLLLARHRRHLSFCWQQVNLYMLMKNVLDDWASLASASKHQVAHSEKVAQLQVLMRRALNSVLIASMESDHSWRASMLFYCWFSEASRSRRCALQYQQEVCSLQIHQKIKSARVAARSFAVELLRSAQVQLCTEHLALAWNTWRQWQARQLARKWRDQELENLRAKESEQDAKYLQATVSLTTFRKALVDSKLASESMLYLRCFFGMLALHAQTASTTRMLQKRQEGAVDQVAAERDRLCTHRVHHAERIRAHVSLIEARLTAKQCFAFWLQAFESASYMKRCARTTKNCMRYLEKIAAGTGVITLIVCWIAWKLCNAKHQSDTWQNQRKEIAGRLAERLFTRWTESLLQSCFDAWHLVCAGLSSQKFHEVETGCDELCELLEAQRCQLENAVAKTREQEDVISELECVMQREASEHSQQRFDAEQAYRRGTNELRNLYADAEATLLARAEEFHAQQEAAVECAMRQESEEMQTWQVEARHWTSKEQSNNDADEVTAHRPSPETHSRSNCKPDYEYDRQGDAATDYEMSQVQSPLSASSPWIENVWNSQQLESSLVACHAIPVAPASRAQVQDPSDVVFRRERAHGEAWLAYHKVRHVPEIRAELSITGSEETDIADSSELTQRQIDFIAKLKDSRDRKASLGVRSWDIESRAWNDASQPLCVAEDVATNREGEGQELFRPEEERFQTTLASETQYWRDASLPLFGHRSEKLENNSDIRRRLSFGNTNGAEGGGDLESVLSDGASQSCSGSIHEFVAIGQDSNINSQPSDHAVHTSACEPLSENLFVQERASRLRAGTDVGVELNNHDVPDRSMSSSDDNLVWRWHTWSAGDFPPFDPNIEPDPVLVQTAEDEAQLELKQAAPQRDEENQLSAPDCYCRSAAPALPEVTVHSPEWCDWGGFQPEHVLEDVHAGHPVGSPSMQAADVDAIVECSRSDALPVLTENKASTKDGGASRRSSSQGIADTHNLNSPQRDSGAPEKSSHLGNHATNALGGDLSSRKFAERLQKFSFGSAERETLRDSEGPRIGDVEEQRTYQALLEQALRRPEVSRCMR